MGARLGHRWLARLYTSFPQKQKRPREGPAFSQIDRASLAHRAPRATHSAGLAHVQLHRVLAERSKSFSCNERVATLHGFRPIEVRNHDSKPPAKSAFIGTVTLRDQPDSQRAAMLAIVLWVDLRIPPALPNSRHVRRSGSDRKNTNQ